MAIRPYLFEPEKMNLLDLLILLALGVGLVRGFTTGLIRQAASILGLILAFVLAVQLMRPIGLIAADSLGFSERLAPLVGFILVFLAIQVGLYALIRFVEAVIGALRLTVINRALGGLAGALKAALALSVVFLVLGSLGVPGPHTRTESVLYEPVSSVLPGTWDYFSERLPEVERISQKFGRQVRAALPEE